MIKKNMCCRQVAIAKMVQFLGARRASLRDAVWQVLSSWQMLNSSRLTVSFEILISWAIEKWPEVLLYVLWNPRK